MVDGIAIYIIGAILIESLWESAKMGWQNGKLNADRLGAMLLGIIVCVGAGLDMFTIFGIPIALPYIGTVFTGVMLSRGANFIHDILAKVGQ